MPIVACPQCPTQLRVPDGTTGPVRCPKCKFIFQADAAEADSGGSSTSLVPVSRPTPVRVLVVPASPPPPPSRIERVEAVVESDDEDDRPSRALRRRDRDDYDALALAPLENTRARLKSARTGMLLLNISFWLYLSSLAMMCLFVLVGWLGSSGKSLTGGGGLGGGSDAGIWLLMLLRTPGIIGLGNWVVAMVGFGFCLAGPAKTRPMAITATSLAAVHFVVVAILLIAMGKVIEYDLINADVIFWLPMSSLAPMIDLFLPVVIDAPALLNTGFVVGTLAGLCEVMRLLFAMLMVKRIAAAAKDHNAAEKAQFGVVATIVVAAGSVLLVLLTYMIFRNATKLSLEKDTAKHMFFGTLMTVYLAFTAMTILPIISTHMTRRAGPEGEEALRPSR